MVIKITIKPKDPAKPTKSKEYPDDKGDNAVDFIDGTTATGKYLVFQKDCKYY